MKWYVLELVVIRNPYQIMASVYDYESKALLGSITATDMIVSIPYDEIDTYGIAAWKGEDNPEHGPSSDLANYDVDWIEVNAITGGVPNVIPEYPTALALTLLAILTIPAMLLAKRERIRPRRA